MAERLVQHKHCPSCGKAMAVGKEYCSDECEQQHEQKQKERKRTLYWFYIAIAIMIIFLVIQLAAAF